MTYKLTCGQSEANETHTTTTSAGQEAYFQQNGPHPLPAPQPTRQAGAPLPSDGLSVYRCFMVTLQGAAGRLAGRSFCHESSHYPGKLPAARSTNTRRPDDRIVCLARAPNTAREARALPTPNTHPMEEGHVPAGRQRG